MTARDRGRCGAPCPSLPGVACELLAEHIGQHEGRHYPVGVVSTGWPVYWATPTGAVTLDEHEVASLKVLLALGVDAYLDWEHGPRLRALAERIGMRT